MNAVISLCHFCEAHGPRPLFCTYTTEDDKHALEPSKCILQCNGCNSLGSETVYITKDQDGTIFCSRECIPNTEVTSFLRQAAIRSITCEVTWNKDGGVVYFSETGGHVLSFTFQLQDTHARGLKRWFSIVVLMKDKMLLLNITPLLSEHMQKISKELQQYADSVYDEEQKICSQRSLRLNTGRNYFGQSRSLLQLTGKEDIFKRLHSHFTWMLKAGALTYSEKLYTSQNLFKQFNLDTKHTIFESGTCSVPDDDVCMSLRALENLLSKEVFRILLYCTLLGICIIIKCQYTEPSIIIKGLARLIPVKSYENIPFIRSAKYNVLVTPSPNACILEEIQKDTFNCIWTAALPNKCPTIMNKIESAINDPNLKDMILHQRVKTLQLEWLGVARVIKSAVEASGAKSDAVVKLKTTFGITEQDNLLLNYWIPNYCQ